MANYYELIARVRSPYALTERDAQEIADALEARGKRVAELEAKNAKLRDAVQKLIDYDSAEDEDDVEMLFNYVAAIIAARAALKGEK